MKTNKTIISILIVIVVVIVVYFIIKADKVAIAPNQDNVTVDNEDTIKLCFYYENNTQSGLKDVSWLKLNLAGSSVTGEFQYIPAEKDSKIGIFEGTIEPVDKMSMTRTANVFWNSSGEGMSVTEELKIVFGEGNATVGFGEMVDRGDGVYVYKDPESLYFIDSMTDVDCNDLNEIITVGK